MRSWETKGGDMETDCECKGGKCYCTSPGTGWCDYAECECENAYTETYNGSPFPYCRLGHAYPADKAPVTCPIMLERKEP